MHIAFSVPVWVLPVVGMVVTWSILTLWPDRGISDQWGLGRSFRAMARLAIGIGVTLSMWLLFFILMFWLATS